MSEGMLMETFFQFFAKIIKMKQYLIKQNKNLINIL